MDFKEKVKQLETLSLNEINISEVKCGNTIVERPRTLVALYDNRDVSEQDAKWFLIQIADKACLDTDRLEKLNPYIIVVDKTQWENVFRGTRNFIKEMLNEVGESE